jgi:hypothetical protein
LFDSLIDEEFFIDLLHGLEGVIEVVKGVSDAFGGLGGILSSVAGLALTHYSKKLPEAMEAFGRSVNFALGRVDKES